MSKLSLSRARRGGFTIVEMTIVLVVIGLLLSGILKGQELINGAKIRAIVDRQNSIRIAWFEFVDHFGAKPGDFARAAEFIQGATNPSTTATAGDGLVQQGESNLAVQHLTLAGLLRCEQCAIGTRNDTTTPNAENSPTNQYDGVISIWHDENNYALIGASRPDVRRLQIHTGPRIPSNILSEVDRKIDDGLANTGGMVFNEYDPTSGGNPSRIRCIQGGNSGSLKSDSVLQYRLASAGSPEGNCGAGIFL